MRRAFSADDLAPTDRKDCPPPDELWEASRAELEPARAREIVRHIAGCPGCSAEWRLAMEDKDRVARGERLDATAATSGRRRWIGVAAVAAVVAGIAVIPFVLDLDRSNRQVVFRSAETSELHSLIPEQQSIARHACVLRWSSVGDDAVYDLEVSRLTLEPIVSERGLVETEYTVAPVALSAVPAGEPIVWRVVARLPDGHRVSSPSYVQSLD
jgi:hypothetical protein